MDVHATRYWGKLLSEMTREELLEVIVFLHEKVDRIYAEKQRERDLGSVLTAPRRW